jgi:hypothetical protein
MPRGEKEKARVRGYVERIFGETVVFSVHISTTWDDR